MSKILNDVSHLKAELLNVNDPKFHDAIERIMSSDQTDKYKAYAITAMHTTVFVEPEPIEKHPCCWCNDEQQEEACCWCGK